MTRPDGSSASGGSGASGADAVDSSDADRELDGADGLGEVDDPAFSSMRAVWRSMREEEPSSTGLSSLLAAARAQAAEMAPREPWWRRALGVLRRPPGLALATVVVLLGGAVLISGRREAFDARPSAAAPADEEAMMARGAAAPTPEKGKEKRDELAAPLEVRGATNATNVDDAQTPGDLRAAEATVKTASASTTPKLQKRTVTTPTMPAGRDQGAGAAGSLSEDKAERPDVTAQAPAPAEPALSPPPPPPPPPPPQRLQPQGAQPKPELEIAADAGANPRAGGKAAGANPPSRPLASEANPEGDSEAVVSGTSTSSPPRGPSVVQLAKQSETAAARGDCAAVRAIATRLRKLDAAFHKQHVERNAAVKRCVK